MAYCRDTAKQNMESHAHQTARDHMIAVPARRAPRPPAASHQLQHPWASSAGGEASKQAKNDDDGSCANEHIRGVGGVVGYQGDVGAQHQLAPYSHRKQDGSRYLSVRGGETDAAEGRE